MSLKIDARELLLFKDGDRLNMNRSMYIKLLVNQIKEETVGRFPKKEFLFSESMFSFIDLFVAKAISDSFKTEVKQKMNEQVVKNNQLKSLPDLLIVFITEHLSNFLIKHEIPSEHIDELLSCTDNYINDRLS